MRARLIFGADLDRSPGGREEDRLNVTPTGVGASRVYSSYTVGPRIYDYDVTFQGFSPYLHGEITPIERLRVTTGVRYDMLSYRFDNSFSGTPLAAGGVFYGQSPDTTVKFRHASPKFGMSYALAPTSNLFAGYSHGFRAPSEGQIFRPSSATTAPAAQALTDSALALKPIKADQFEVGVRGTAAKVSYELVAYDLTKRDDLVSQRDTVTNFTQTVNTGKTSHRGVELGLGMPFMASLRGDVAFSYARHKYDEWVTTTANLSGEDQEMAPRVMANTRLTWTPTGNSQVQLEWVRLGHYWMDAANTTTYGGHDLLNLRARSAVTKHVAVFGSVYNVTDKRYADSASISSATPVYSPGLPRTYYAGVDAKWQ